MSILKKPVIASILAGVLVSLNTCFVFAQTCEKDNKVTMDPNKECCCCKETTKDNFVCKVMKDTNNKKCPGQILIEGDENHKVKISTQTSNSCICKFTVSR